MQHIPAQLLPDWLVENLTKQGLGIIDVDLSGITAGALNLPASATPTGAILLTNVDGSETLDALVGPLEIPFMALVFGASDAEAQLRVQYGSYRLIHAEAVVPGQPGTANEERLVCLYRHENVQAGADMAAIEQARARDVSHSLASVAEAKLLQLSRKASPRRQGVIDQLMENAASLRSSYDAERTQSSVLRMTLRDVLSSTSWQKTTLLRKAIARLRGLTYAPINLPPLLDTTPRGYAATVKNVVKAAPKATRVVPLLAMVVEVFDWGGLEKVALDMSRQFKAKGFDVVVLVTLHGGRLSEQAIRDGLDVRVFNGDVDEMNAAIEALSPDVAVVQHSYAGVAALVRTGAVVVEILQNIYHWQRGNAQIAEARRQMTKFVAGSKAVRDYSVDMLGLSAADVVVINNAIEPKGLMRPSRENLRARRLASPDIVFAMTSHIWANKCHHALLTAFKRVHAVHPQARLVLDGAVGHADVAATLQERISEAGLDQVVRIKNSTNRRALSETYTEAHVFVLPSIVEGFSIATLEGIYFGLPEILSDTGGARDLLGDTSASPLGILIEPAIFAPEVTPEAIDRIGRLEAPRHVDSLTSAMMEMAANRDEWIERGLAGLDRVEQFAIEPTIARYIALFESLGVTLPGIYKAS